MTALVAPRPSTATAPGRERRPWIMSLPLIAILVAQAILTVRLIPGTYASGDEGRYIYAGHQLIHEFWHGGGSPYYDTYFSGAPVIYPVLAAMADRLGGLVEVCLLSLCFMMTATVALFGTARRLFGYLSGLLAAAWFAGLGMTQDLGALATYDAMSLTLVTIAAYCAVRTGDAEKNRARWLLTLLAALFFANATKYVTLLFDPIVICLAALQVSDSGIKRMAMRILSLGLTALFLDLFALFLAGSAYVKGLLFSTLARSGGTQAVFATVKVPYTDIAAHSWKWMGLAIAGSAAAVVLALVGGKQRRQLALLTGLLFLGGILVTIGNMHLHTLESMRKHDDFSAWFSCLACGSIPSYLIARRSRLGRGAAVFAIAAASLIFGIHYSQTAKSTFEAGGSDTPLKVATALKPYLRLPHGRYLLGGFASDEILYMDSVPVPWYREVDDLYIKYPIPGRGGDSHGQNPGLACSSIKPHCIYLEGIAGYRAAIKAHWFTLISMWGDHGTTQDAEIEQAVEHTPGYILLTRVGGKPTWIYAPVYYHLLTRPSSGRFGLVRK